MTTVGKQTTIGAGAEPMKSKGAVVQAPER